LRTPTDRRERRTAGVTLALALAVGLREAQQGRVRAAEALTRDRGLAVDLEHLADATGLGLTEADHQHRRQPDGRRGRIEVDRNRRDVGHRRHQPDQADVVRAERVDVERRLLDRLGRLDHATGALEHVDRVEVHLGAGGDGGLRRLTEHRGIHAVRGGQHPVGSDERAGAEPATDLEHDDGGELAQRRGGAAEDRERVVLGGREVATGIVVVREGGGRRERERHQGTRDLRTSGTAHA
jgi:hypothetical protein